MGKNKLSKFAECKVFAHVFEPTYDEVLDKDFELKGKWNQEFFKNNNPIVLELACGRGEYTIGLAERFPEKNFIGIDLKGARIWRGAKTADERGMKNVAFVRTHIELITSFFEENEVSEIWLTFPDPQKKKAKKRLTSARYLNDYKNLLKQNGKMHLKTDSATMYGFTIEMQELNAIKPEVATDDLYQSGLSDDVLSIRTYYESQFLELNKTIKYTRFTLSKSVEYKDLPKKEKK